MKFRSGLQEGLDVVLRYRKPADIRELYDWMSQDMKPLHDALAKLWTRDNQEGIRLANELVMGCVDLLDASAALPDPASKRERVRIWAFGIRWTPEMTEKNKRALNELAQARKRYAEHVRACLGRADAELFTLVESPADPNDAKSTG
jgi:hypothetical protein